jgi:hypothetical protein
MAGGMQMVIRAIAMGLGALITNNYFTSTDLLSFSGLPQAITIAIVLMAIDMYLPLAEAWLDAKL